ncbi:hypothetical protein V8E54_014921 [Elaphomyces granulatus]
MLLHRSFRPQGEGCLHDLVRSAVEMLSIQRSSVPQSSGARSLEQKGVLEDQIRRLGKWAVEIMEKSLGRLAGPKRVFPRRSFYIPRDKVEPPPELLELVWPELDGYIEVRDAEQLDPVKRVQEHQLCLAGAGVVNLLHLPPPPLRSVCREVRFQHINSPESTPEHRLAAAIPTRSIDKTQEQTQLILRNQRRRYQLILFPNMAPRVARRWYWDGSDLLYTEWFTGLGNKPSVVWIDRQFGTKWRSENKEKVFYSVRKTIIDRVERW